MPKEYIYEPWTAPLSVQKKARCIIGKDYPKPGKLFVDSFFFFSLLDSCFPAVLNRLSKSNTIVHEHGCSKMVLAI